MTRARGESHPTRVARWQNNCCYPDVSSLLVSGGPRGGGFCLVVASRHDLGIPVANVERDPVGAVITTAAHERGRTIRLGGSMSRPEVDHVQHCAALPRMFSKMMGFCQCDPTRKDAARVVIGLMRHADSCPAQQIQRPSAPALVTDRLGR